MRYDHVKELKKKRNKKSVRRNERPRGDEWQGRGTCWAAAVTLLCWEEVTPHGRRTTEGVGDDGTVLTSAASLAARRNRKMGIQGGREGMTTDRAKAVQVRQPDRGGGLPGMDTAGETRPRLAGSKAESPRGTTRGQAAAGGASGMGSARRETAARGRTIGDERDGGHAQG